MNNSGEIYFILLVSLGKDIPFLPIEIRKKILKSIFYNLTCVSCGEVIISYKPYIINYLDGYSLFNGNCLCRMCNLEY